MRLRRLAAPALAALIAVPATMAATAGPARAATGPYGGSATSHLVHLNALNATQTSGGLPDIRLARSTSAVQSTGLAAAPGLPVPATAAGKRSYSRAANLDASIAGNTALSNILSVAEQSAPPTNAAPATDTLAGPVTVAPVASLTAARASAHSRWGATDTTCLEVGTPISTATSEVADASLILGQAPIGASLVSVTNAVGGAALSNTNIGLVNVAGQANKGLRAQAIAQLDGVVLFKGSANEVTINVLAPPTLTATATGSAATSTVTYNAPVLQIIRAGAATTILDASTANQNITLPSGILQLRLGSLIQSKSDTQATGDAVLLEVKLLDVAGTGTLADLKIAPLTATATVPQGGIECGGSGPDPLANLQVDASTPTVFPNGLFDYVITVPNSGNCTLTNVRIVFTVTGPAGTTITSTAPAASNIAGLIATWNDIGPIAPGELKTLKATIKVPSNAPPGAVFTGTAVATGVCNGAPAGKTATSGPIPSVGSPSSAQCDLSASSINSSHREVRVGDFFNEYVRVTNLGRGTCQAITVTLPYPPHTSFVSCTDNCTADNARRIVTWTIPSLPSGHSKDLVATFKVNPGATGNLPTTVTITSGNQTVRDSTSLPRVTASSILNSLTQRSRGILPRTGGDDLAGMVGLTLLGSFLALRAAKRRRA